MDLGFKNSKCRGSWLHRLDVVGTSEEGVLERCQICHMKISFRIRGGVVSAKKYLSYHMRNALPKEHRLFAHEYAYSRKLKGLTYAG